VQNGVKVYVTALPSDDIEGAVAELNDIGKNGGGEAIGYEHSQLWSQLVN